MSEADGVFDLCRVDLLPPVETIRGTGEGGQSTTLPVVTKPAADDPWRSDNPDVVTFGQPALMLYCNEQNQIVIRQERNWCDEDDSFIYLSPENVDRFVERLMTCKAEAESQS